MINIRDARPVKYKRCKTKQASIVFPKPTSSASKTLGQKRADTSLAINSWWGIKSMRPPKKPAAGDRRTSL